MSSGCFTNDRLRVLVKKKTTNSAVPSQISWVRFSFFSSGKFRKSHYMTQKVTPVTTKTMSEKPVKRFNKANQIWGDGKWQWGEKWLRKMHMYLEIHMINRLWWHHLRPWKTLYIVKLARKRFWKIDNYLYLRLPKVQCIWWNLKLHLLRVYYTRGTEQSIFMY